MPPNQALYALEELKCDQYYRCPKIDSHVDPAETLQMVALPPASANDKDQQICRAELKHGAHSRGECGADHCGSQSCPACEYALLQDRRICCNVSVDAVLTGVLDRISWTGVLDKMSLDYL